MRFNNIGTGKIGIGLCNKMGTQSLHALKSTVIKDTQDSVDDKKYVIILRDSFDKWESGYWQEVQMLYPVLLEQDTELNVMWKMHDPMNSWYYTFNEGDWATPWMYHGHGEFWIWNSAHESCSLGVCAQLPTMYFLELKDLSNPKFLDWLKEQDKDWESVIKIPHRNKSADFDKKPILKHFWKEYNEGLILQDKILVSPFSKKYPPKTIMGILEKEQQLIDFIRKNHERYLKFD